MQTAFGADLSLNHGSIVRVDMKGDIVTNITGIYSWDKKDNHKLTLKSTPKELLNKVHEISNALMVNVTLGIPLGLDWSAQSIYWRTTKIFVVQMGLFLGMFFSEIIRRNIPIIPITPNQLREYFNQSVKLPKKEFQYYILLLFPPPKLFKTWANEDDIDAFILAVYTILTRGNNDNE